MEPLLILLIINIYIKSCSLAYAAECRYATWGTNYRPIKMDICSDIKWGHIIHSQSRHCNATGYITNRLYYKENCPSDPSEWYEQDTSVPCYIDRTTDCSSIEMNSYIMTYDKSVSYEYRPPEINREPDENPKQACYYDRGAEYFGSHPIYDTCLANPSSTQYPYVKGEYYNGGFEKNCSYKVSYYSDSKCRHKIGSSYTYNEQCREATNLIPYSFDFPECPWRPNTVWVIVFCVLGCCCCGCGCYCCIKWLDEVDEDTRRILCCCLYLLGYCDVCCEYRMMQRDERNRRAEQQARERVERIKQLEEEKRQEEYDEIAMQKLRNRKEREREEQELRDTQRTNGMDCESGNMQVEKDSENDMNDEVIVKQGTLSYSAVQCIICLDVLLDNEASRLVCGHKFHTHCIEEYKETKSECPLCRKKIVFNHE